MATAPSPPPKELKGFYVLKSQKCDATRLFVAEYNALVRAMAKAPLGEKGSLVKGRWYFCPNFRNVFKFNQTKGGWKEGTVIFDMDIGDSTEHGERADFGDSYRNKSTKQADYYNVDEAVYWEQMAADMAEGKVKKPFRDTFPDIFKAVFDSGLTVKQLKEKANKEFVQPGMTSKGDLVTAVLITAAKRHTNNDSYESLDAVEKLCGASVKTKLDKNKKKCQKDWVDLVTRYAQAAETTPVKSPTGAADFPMSSEGLKQRKGASPSKTSAGSTNLLSKFDEVVTKEKEVEKGGSPVMLFLVGILGLSAFLISQYM